MISFILLENKIISFSFSNTKMIVYSLTLYSHNHRQKLITNNLTVLWLYNKIHINKEIVLILI